MRNKKDKKKDEKKDNEKKKNQYLVGAKFH
jgi:hypothetical protein